MTVTLATEHEMRSLGIADLPERVRALGIVHRHVAIADGQIPEPAVANRLTTDVVALLRDGTGDNRRQERRLQASEITGTEC